MDSLQKQLERLMNLNPDTELHFDDGVLPANSNVLSFFSSVLHSAIEAHSEGDKDISTLVIPMKGVTMAQWLKVAPFWHPVEPAAVVHIWADAELLLRIGSRFDLRPALDKASEFLAVNVNTLTVSSSGAAVQTCPFESGSSWRMSCASAAASLPWSTGLSLSTGLAAAH